MKAKNMKKAILRKGLAAGLIILFIGTGVISIVSGAGPDSNNFNAQSSSSSLRNIMLTGYWNPTGQMIAQFSNSTYLNPDGWKGENWEGMGYNIYSFFPTPGTYNGTFEVDYQDTWEDFWNITAQIHPVAIISFGAGRGPWEIEYNARNLDNWIDDEKPPYQPTPCPPDDSVPVNYVRHSTLPVQEIEDAVNNETSIRAWVDWGGNPGRYLCEYMAYLGMWYQALYNVTDDPYPCRAAGFIHVKSNVPLKDAIEAMNITIRETIKYLLNIDNSPSSPTITGPASGKVGTEYEYTFVASDPDGDDVYYFIDWGDGTSSNWLGAFNSGEGIGVKHAWAEKGTYTIKAKAKDVHNAESDWGMLEVSMPKIYRYSPGFLLEKIIQWIEQILGGWHCLTLSVVKSIL